MKVYLAGPFGEILRLRKWEKYIIEAGHISVSRWLNCDPDKPWGDIESARMDLEDIDRCDAMISRLVPGEPVVRGSRHVEFGYALAKNKIMVTVNRNCDPENIFHRLPNVMAFAHIGPAVDYLDLLDRARQ
jgi:nucleoside 2-deoxyribosyltransferase